MSKRLKLTAEQRQQRRARRGKPAGSMVLSTPDVFQRAVIVPIKEGAKPNRRQRRAMMDTIRAKLRGVVGNRVLKRVQRRRELDGADWLKQMRRDARKAPTPVKSQELRFAVLDQLGIKDSGKPSLERKRAHYDKLPTQDELRRG